MMSTEIQVLWRYDRRGCIHLYNAETDGPMCNSRIKRKDWELLKMDYEEWRSKDWRCWACPWRLAQLEGDDGQSI
jgi:hypothetical protein